MDAERNAPAPRDEWILSDLFAAWDWCIALRIHARYKSNYFFSEGGLKPSITITLPVQSLSKTK
jgi:hypothetical protein